MPYRSEADAVLAIWRRVERELTAAAPGSDEATCLVDDWARLRTEHARLTKLAQDQHRPLPEPWPEPAIAPYESREPATASTRQERREPSPTSLHQETPGPAQAGTVADA